MVEGLIGKKIGMAQIFEEDGTSTQVTVIEAGPCVVVQRKTVECDGYDAVQLGLVDPAAAKRANRPLRGHHEKAGVPPTRMLREFKVLGDAGQSTKAGDQVVVDIFKDATHVDISGFSRGKGFQGVIKRHGFGGGKATHGSMHHRAPGSIGQSATPSKVMKGMRGPGQMGNKRITQKNCRVVRVDLEKNMLLVRGSIPGAPGTTLSIRHTAGEAIKLAASTGAEG